MGDRRTEGRKREIGGRVFWGWRGFFIENRKGSKAGCLKQFQFWSVEKQHCALECH